MKYLVIVLAIAIGTLCVDKSANANQESVTPGMSNSPKENRPKEESNSAMFLMTEPVTITEQWGNNQQTNNLQQTGDLFLNVRDNKCNKINPVALIENPADFFKQCPQPTNNTNNPYTQPVEYLKVPKLDRGIKVPVSKF
ncbi:MAG: hypothetical protein QNJ36_19245 [Calothrix sp. MO_167.B42]|nr:hypothetical protein [Calothrix sp. MO_167.B42]